MAEFDLLGYRLVVEPLAGGKYRLFILDPGRRPTKWIRRAGGDPWLSWSRYSKEIAQEIGRGKEEVEEALKSITQQIILRGPKTLGLVPPEGELAEDGSSFERAMGLLESLIDRVFIEEHDAEPYLTLKMENGGGPYFMNLAIRGEGFEAFLNALYYTKEGKGLRDEVRRDVSATLEARAYGEQKRERLELLGWVGDGKILIDLGDPNWRAVEIDAAGWRIVTPAPNPFKRTELTATLPEPVPVHNPLQVLESLVPPNVSEEQVDDAKRVIPVWVATVPLSHIPKPILVFRGPHGSGKTTFTRMICSVYTNLDVQSLHAVDIRDVVIKLWSSPVVGFDNVGSIGEETAELLSMATTGGQYISRELYTDRGIRVVRLRRAICLNGISPNITHYPDLTDRSIVLDLRRLEPGERREEAEILHRIRSERPAILGAVAQALSGGLKHLNQVKAELAGKPLPRMADWAVWGEAVARGLGMEPFEFLNAYLRLCREGVLEVLEEDPVGKAILRFASKLEEETWTGTPSELAARLKAELEADEMDEFPKPTWFTRRLKALVPNLREKGVRVVFRREGKKGRIIEVSRVPEVAEVLAPEPEVSENPEKEVSENSKPFEKINNVKTPSDGSDGSDGIFPVLSPAHSQHREAKCREEGGGKDLEVTAYAVTKEFCQNPIMGNEPWIARVHNIAQALQLLKGNFTELELNGEVAKAGIGGDKASYWLQRAVQEGEVFEISTGVYCLVRPPKLMAPVRAREDLPELVVDYVEGRVVTVGPFKAGQLAALPKHVANRLAEGGKVELLEVAEGGA
jgi:DNA polymerase III delta prime subunit